MKAILLTILLSLSIFASEQPKEFLEETSKYAIKIGSGDTKTVYMFIDPKCKHSKKILKKIMDSKSILSHNTYYIFLYELERLESIDLIYYIYQSEEQKVTLLEVMIDEEIVDLDEFEVTKKTKNDIGLISKVAKKLDMTQRPYMISFEKNSKFCTVSEGKASCLNEFE
ncbi:hypothetical protein N9A28_03675 [Sulfurimonas sp.]|nr:hypothetical protein [Sulfurimonas sp.]